MTLDEFFHDQKHERFRRGDPGGSIPFSDGKGLELAPVARGGGRGTFRGLCRRRRIGSRPQPCRTAADGPRRGVAALWRSRVPPNLSKRAPDRAPPGTSAKSSNFPTRKNRSGACEPYRRFPVGGSILIKVFSIPNHRFPGSPHPTVKSFDAGGDHQSKGAIVRMTRHKTQFWKRVAVAVEQQATRPADSERRVEKWDRRIGREEGLR
jgi:hypothetical protein